MSAPIHVAEGWESAQETRSSCSATLWSGWRVWGWGAWQWALWPEGGVTSNATAVGHLAQCVQVYVPLCTRKRR